MVYKYIQVKNIDLKLTYLDFNPKGMLSWVQRKERRGVMKVIAEKSIVLGKQYMVQPKGFHRAILATAAKVATDGIVFKVDFCELCDRDQVSQDNPYVTATSYDVKRAVGENCFFS